VQKGDTLYSISKKFNCTVEQLKQLNTIQDNAISVGQKLKVK
jgi:LysM repeat protein